MMITRSYKTWIDKDDNDASISIPLQHGKQNDGKDTLCRSRYRDELEIIS